MSDHARILAALQPSESAISEHTLANTLTLLDRALTIVVTGTWSSGRMELARSLSDVSGRTCISTLYYEGGPQLERDEAAVVETISASHQGEWLNFDAVDASDWVNRVRHAPRLGGLLWRSGDQWQLKFINASAHGAPRNQ